MSRKLKPQPKLSVAKRQPPRWQRERNLVLIVWIVISLAIVIALGLVGYWSYDTYVAAWHKPVAKIHKTVLGNETVLGNRTVLGDETIVKMDYYVKMLRLQIINSGQTTIDTTTLPYKTLRDIEDSELIRRATSELGIQVTQQEISDEINSYLTAAVSGEGNSTQDLAELYEKWLDLVRLTDAEYRGVVESTLLREKLADYLKEQQPETTKQVHLHAILIDTEEKALEVIERAGSGEDFTALATELSIDEESKKYGGDLGWVPKGVLITELDNAAFKMEVGELSEPIMTSKGYYIITLSEIDENRPLDDAYRDILAATEFDNLLNTLRTASAIEDYLDRDKIDWAIDKIV